MHNNIYSEKEILIFNGVTKLINEGVRLHAIKVSDIAEAAGIGKGTIYDYFKSKEDILKKALLYSMEIGISKVLSKIHGVDGFKNKCYILFEITEICVRDYQSAANPLFSSISPYEFNELINKDIEWVDERDRLLRDIVKSLVILGIKDGLIKEQDDKEYAVTVFVSVVMGFQNIISCNAKEDWDNLEEAKNRSYKLLIKGLN